MPHYWLRPGGKRCGLPTLRTPYLGSGMGEVAPPPSPSPWIRPRTNYGQMERVDPALLQGRREIYLKTNPGEETKENPLEVRGLDPRAFHMQSEHSTS